MRVSNTPLEAYTPTNACLLNPGDRIDVEIDSHMSGQYALSCDLWRW